MFEAIQHLRSSDPVLSTIIDRVGDYAIGYRDPSYETLVRSIVYQQLSGRVANVIYERLVKAVGGRVTPASVLKLRPSRMRAAGLSAQKTLTSAILPDILVTAAWCSTNFPIWLMRSSLNA